MRKALLIIGAAVVASNCLADQAAATAAGVDLDVAYCESTGAQYIDTGILGNPGIKVEAEIMWTDEAPSEDEDSTCSGPLTRSTTAAHPGGAISSPRTPMGIPCSASATGSTL
ncbi:MAG: hypothetical protein IKE55_12795 [Kiritimatiellae bacterium]|nr:hypothetical protein [Kiritimatiellia bacterium]